MRSTALMLVSTMVGLAVAGVLALFDLELGPDVALILVAMVPLLPLVLEMVSVQCREPRSPGALGALC